ncbi:MAG TPA: rhomboid family intramembrane serine protease [Candidatus Thermoplasmatota archaeon]|nr:rhomboid family intramembrane serine protease [Candidatus Thermoplasmatota archaeon]
MSLHPVSILAVAVILAALAVAWSRRFIATGALAVANLVVFALSAFGPTVRVGDHIVPVIHRELALQSVHLQHGEPLGFLQLLTSMFVHADFGHIFSNLIILLAFALPFEERIGTRRFLAIYLGAGLMGSLAQTAYTGWSSVALMGASGAVFGIIGAFAAAFPTLVVPLPMPLFVVMIFVRARVWVAALVFTAMQVLYFALLSPFDNTAYAAHFGGLAAGIVLGTTVARHAAPRRSAVRVDLVALQPFAKDNGTSTALQHMTEHRDEPQVFQAWLDRFFRTARCPTCDHTVMPHRGEVVCTQGHRFDVRSKAAAKA